MHCWITHHINALPRLLALDALLMPEIEVSVPKLKIRFFISKRIKCCRRCDIITGNAGSKSYKTNLEVTKQNILFVYQGRFSEMSNLTVKSNKLKVLVVVKLNYKTN